MTRKLTAYALMAIMFVASFTACNSSDPIEIDDNGYNIEVLYSNTAITSFSLKPNTKVLANLDSVYFTIDLVGARIFNAQPLPYGTKITKLLADIGTNGSSKIEVKVTDSKVMKDTTLVYNTSSIDSIDFSANVSIIVTSLNELQKRTYDVKVNVYDVKPDSLYWGKTEWAKLTDNGTPKAQKAVEYLDKVYSFVKTTDYSLTVIDGDMETTEAVTFPAEPNLRTLTASSNALYVLSTTGDMYKSTDGKSWSATGMKWNHIYGGYGDKIIGNKYENGKYIHTMYPASVDFTESEVATDCPVSGTSDMLLFDNKWSTNPQTLMVGGCKADGSLTGEAWGFDGSKWSRISEKSIPTPCEGMSLFPYFTFKTSTSNWHVTEYTTLFALGGRKADGVNSPTVYISLDQGITWKVADELAKLPMYIPSMAYSQAIVRKSMLTARSASGKWQETAPIALPAWWMIADNGASSRAIAPIKEWECPYVYLYGGIDRHGNVCNTVWRGVINRLTFKPLQ